jgi:hypothetical protein
MIKHLLLGAITFGMVALPAQADEFSSQGVPGEFGNTADATNNFRRSDSFGTTNQRLPDLQQTTTAILSPISGPVGRNGLPMTSTDSFVLNSAGEGELIYGGEGADGIPPYNEFTAEHRIERGIQGARAEGLTTLHGSLLPSATGNDEFIGGTEWLQAGQNGGVAGSGILNHTTGRMFGESDFPASSLAPKSLRNFTVPTGNEEPSNSGSPAPPNTRTPQQNITPDPGF